MNVAVVGGGIVGLAAAYYLAEGGADVTVYEKGSIGSGSTERSAGGIRAQFSTPVNVALSLKSMEVWDSFDAIFGTGIDYRRPGYLFCARTPESAVDFAANVAMQRERGVPSELLDPARAREHCPGLIADRFRAATYCSIDGFCDPHLALGGFAEAAREMGTEIHTRAPVTAVLREADRVRGVEICREGGESESIDVDLVVNAAGPWAHRIGRMAGIDLPIAPRRRQVLVTDPETPVPEDVPLTIDIDTGSYFRPERRGKALVGGHFSTVDPDADPDGYSRGMDFDWAGEALERVADYTTYFGPDTRIERGWAGLYAVTPDHHPVIEVTIPGLITAAGFSGHGFQHAPATGKLVAELALKEEATLVDISSLGSDRFDDGALVAERNVA